MAKPKTKYSQQNIVNQSFDEETNVSAALGLGYDGTTNPIKSEADDVQIKVVKATNYVYYCKSAVGTAESTEAWKVFRLDSDGNKMYASASSDYEHSALDPASLNYSYS